MPKTLTEHNCYYHLTSQDELDSILQNGIKCSLGDNSKSVNENEKRIYLCKYTDLPYWSILLGKSVVIQIKELGVNISEYDTAKYSFYDEYIYYRDIPAESVKHLDVKLDTRKAMADLCIDYLYDISRLTEYAAMLNNNKYLSRSLSDREFEEDVSRYFNGFFAVMDKIDYSSISKEEIQDELVKAGENGMYTFCDMYLDTNNKLWEQLIYYNNCNGMLQEKYKKLYNYIKSTFPYLSDVTTGGWTG